MSAASQAKLQLYAPHNGTDGNGLWVRTGWDTDYDAWNNIAISSQSFTNTVDLRAPIFYDSNDTGYFIDSNARRTTNINGVSARTKMTLGLTAKYQLDRSDYTGSTEYWVGTMGWGTTDMNAVADWGSGFVDSWGGPANQPDGTSHWVGTQAFHGTFGSGTAYGWQLVGGPIGNLRFRSAWPSWSSWTTVAMHDRNDGSSGALYAGVYYDSNNTAYYVDANGTSTFLSAYFIGGIGGVANTSQYYDAALEIRERGFGGAQDDTWATAPRIGFHWGGRVAMQVALSSSGILSVLDGDASNYSAFRCGNAQVNSLGVGTNPSGTAGEIRATNNITAYYSDRRLKENIVPIENAIEKLMAISGVTFNSNETAEKYGYIDKRRQVGVIAQEIAKVLPEVVVPAPFDIGQNEDGTEYSISGENYQTVQYEKIIPLLIEAFKAQQAHINRLQQQIDNRS
jgi:hypothetical protein